MLIKMELNLYIQEVEPSAGAGSQKRKLGDTGFKDPYDSDYSNDESVEVCSYKMEYNIHLCLYYVCPMFVDMNA
jgi:hypothetical protein